jgi:hypothetical protein
MPRNGRSARAGAVLLANFSSSNGNTILSSLAAAAGDGSKLEKSESSRDLQRQYPLFYDKARKQEADMR